jgi:membrane fusion protein
MRIGRRHCAAAVITMRKTLFRPGIAAASQQSWHGKVLLMQPLPMRVASAAIVLFAVGALVFLSQAQYTRRVSAAGLLAPDAGLIRVQSPQGGVILERRVREGQQVKAGDVLYVVSAEVMYAPEAGQERRAGTTAAQLEQVHARQALIQTDTANSTVIEQRERAEMQLKIHSLQAEIEQLDQELAVQRERVRAKTEIYDRHAQAQAQGFLSPLALQQKYDELLDYKARLQTMQRSRLGLVRDLESARVQLDTASERNALAHSQLARQSADVKQDLVTREANQRTLVTAPQDGVVAAVLAEPGQRVDRDTMLTIVPSQSQLEVQVMLPSSAIGFVREGDPVTLKFDAFPYERYGSVRGRIREISHASLAGQESGDAAAAAKPDNGFRVRILLPSQYFTAGRQRFALRPGMKVDTQFVQERRSLLAWLTDPLAVLADKT